MRLNWSRRHGPDEFDNTAPSEVSYAFDLHRDARPGAPSSWPAKVNGQTFGPAFVRKCWQSGLVVIAEIEGFPHPVAAQEVRWGASGGVGGEDAGGAKNTNETLHPHHGQGAGCDRVAD